MKTDLIFIDDIVIDAGTQVRVKLNDEKVSDYAESMRDGDVFPRPVVYFDGSRYILADGFHRYFAMKENGEPMVDCEVINGPLRDAKLHAIEANNRHGIQLTKEDKLRQVEWMLDDSEWSQWSDREIGRRCGCSHTFVGKLRSQRGEKKSTVKFKKGDKVTSMNTSAKNADKDEDIKEEKPSASPAPEVEMEKFQHPTEQEIMLEELSQENEKLRVQLAEKNFDGTDEERISYKAIIDELKEQNQELSDALALANRQISSITISRDMYMNENAELKSQVKYFQRRLQKLEKQAA